MGEAMKSILDKDFEYTNSASTDIRLRFIANGLKPRKPQYSELERLRRFRRQVESLAGFVNGRVTFDEMVFEEMLAEADGVSNDH